MVSAKERALKFMAGASALLGTLFLCLAAYYLYQYAINAAGTGKHEYTEGIALGLLVALPFWVLVSCFIFPLRQQFSRGVYCALNLPAVLLLAAYGIFNAQILVRALG